MNKEKFQKKCQELIDYEDQILQQVEKFIENKKEKLNKIDLVCSTYLFWDYFGENKNSLDRIEFKENYTCNLFVTICKKDDNPYDIDLESISLIYTISILRRGLFIPSYKFVRLNIKNFEDTFNESYQSIIENGYEKTLSTYK